MTIVKFTLDPDNPQGFTDEELARLSALTEEQINAAALSDPDNLPLTEEELDRMVEARFVRRVREGTGLSQVKFAEAYQINLGRLRDLEQGRTRPDSALRAYYAVIARRPDVVSECLASAGV